MAVGDAPVTSRFTPRVALGLTGALALGGCAGGYVAPPAYPVFLLEQVRGEQSAWAAAGKQDQPVLIIGPAVYGLSTECIPTRYYAADDAGRLHGSAAEGRLIGSSADARLGGSAGDGRLTGGASDGRLGGSASDGRLNGNGGDGRLTGGADSGRLTGGADSGRLTGGADSGRLLGSGQQVRSFGADGIGRLYGATASTLTCRLGADRSTIYVFGVAQGMAGYLYSPRMKGQMPGVVLQLR